MFSSTEEIVSQIEEIQEEFKFLISTEIEEKTFSVLKARIVFKPGIFIQLYVNVKRIKIFYALLMDGIRLYGRDFIWGEWHRHPFDTPERHDRSEEGKRETTLKEFFLEALHYLEEEDLF